MIYTNIEKYEGGTRPRGRGHRSRKNGDKTGWPLSRRRRRVALELLVLLFEVFDDLQKLLLLQLLLQDEGLVHDVTLGSSALDGYAGGQLVLEELLEEVGGPLVVLRVAARRRRGRDGSPRVRTRCRGVEASR